MSDMLCYIVIDAIRNGVKDVKSYRLLVLGRRNSNAPWRRLYLLGERYTVSLSDLIKQIFKMNNQVKINQSTTELLC